MTSKDTRGSLYSTLLSQWKSIVFTSLWNLHNSITTSFCFFSKNCMEIVKATRRTTAPHYTRPKILQNTICFVYFTPSDQRLYDGVAKFKYSHITRASFDSPNLNNILEIFFSFLCCFPFCFWFKSQWKSRSDIR